MKELEIIQQPKLLDGEILPPVQKRPEGQSMHKAIFIRVDKTVNHHSPTYVFHITDERIEDRELGELAGEAIGVCIFGGLDLAFRGIARLIERRNRRLQGRNTGGQGSPYS